MSGGSGKGLGTNEGRLLENVILQMAFFFLG